MRFLPFSGHNDRAIVALCRFWRRFGLRFDLVSAGAHDPIHRTAYANAVVFERLDVLREEMR